MMATPHMVAGAAVGRVLRRPWLAWPAALASHFLLDIIPHLDTHSLFGVKGGRPTPPEAASAITDFLVGAMLVGWLTLGRPNRRVVLGAALCGMLMDLVEYVPPFGSWLRACSGGDGLIGFLHGIQHNVGPAQWPLGFGTQVAVICVATAMLLAWRGVQWRPAATARPEQTSA